jgi:GNAT superfamily N-acetyltransferase
VIFADLSLACRLEAADAARYADYAHARPNIMPEVNPSVMRIAGGIAVYAGANSPFSRAVGLGLAGPVAPAEFARVNAFYRGRAIPARVSLCPLADGSYLELLNRHDYRTEMFMHVWFRELAPAAGAFQPTPDLVVRPIRPGEAELWVQTAFGGGVDSDDAQPDRTAIIAGYPYMIHTTCYLAWLDGQPAGAGTLALHDGVASLFGASTRPRYRHRGVQHALLAVRLADAAGAGCDLALVHTEPGSPSQRNVERLGFRLAYTKVMLRGAEPRSPLGGAA